VAYLGHMVSKHGIATDPDKTQRVSNWPTPTTIQEMQQFLGLASYDRRFIKNFSTIAKQLHRLTEKGHLFNWTTECANSFAELKQRLTTAPVLAFPDYSKQFILDTDTSQEGIGAVISQECNGQEQVIAYASRTLSKAERKYCVTRKELLAVVTFIRHFRPYLLGRMLQLRTDHSSLQWLQNFREPEGQLARWLEQLQEYDFTIVHHAGGKHSNADAMSRRPSGCDQTTVDCNNPDNHPVAVAQNVNEDTVETTDEMYTFQINDAVISPILHAKKTGTKPADDELKGEGRAVHILLQQWDQLFICNGLLYRKFEKDNGNTHFQLIVPRCKQEDVLREAHAGPWGGHLGEDKTKEKIKEQFYWPGYSQSVQEWCQTCPHCAVRKNPTHRNRGALKNIQSGYPMQIMAMDIMGPFPETKWGNCYVLVISDYFTRWVEAFGIPNQEATTVARKLVDEVCCRFGIPEQLHSDMGAQFESKLMHEICKLLQIHKTHTMPYHPQSDGLVERLNRTIQSMLATTIDESGGEWEDHLPKVCFAYNTSKQSSTGFTPFQLMYGRLARIPLDVIYKAPMPEPTTIPQYVVQLRQSLEKAYKLARENMKTTAGRQKESYDHRTHGKPYKVGDKVWLHSIVIPRGRAKKLHCPWNGPFTVVKCISNVVYRIQDSRARR